MTEDEIQKEFEAWRRGDIRHTSGWEGELAKEAWSEKKREYNRRYRLRHPERERAFNAIYKARQRARRQGVPLPPIPNWHTDPDRFEVEFARGRRPKKGSLLERLTQSHARSYEYIPGRARPNDPVMQLVE